MSRIADRFAELRSQGRKALIPYITAGDPAPAATLSLMHALVEAGADVIELGVPFSDPMADGPVIQRASERALKHDVSLHDVLDMVRQFRRTDASTPVVLMGYLNPIEVFGYAPFCRAAGEAGVDGVLTVDLPPEEADDYLEAMGEHGLDPIFLIAPTTGEARMDAIAKYAGGFVYFVSIKGVTGAANLDIDAVGAGIERIRRHTSLPVGVGFGISDARSASAMARVADAVIVGSALVKRVEGAQDDRDRLLADAKGFLSELRQAIDAAE